MHNAGYPGAGGGSIERTSSRWLGQVVLALALLSLALAVGGFGVFYSSARTPPAAGIRADGIVALTGGSARIESAVDLLGMKRANRLLITGVHPQTSERQLRQLTSADSELFRCCIDIDRSALDTRGNAEEARRWASRHGFRSLIVVTSDYHMPRAMLEFSRRIPGVNLVPYPVTSRADQAAASGAWRLWLSEYVKYLLALARAPFLERGA